jgi:hypothetical protein
LSIWQEIEKRTDDFINPFYVDEHLELIPKTEYVALRIWKEYFLKYTTGKGYYKMTEVSADEHKENLMKDAIEKHE